MNEKYQELVEREVSRKDFIKLIGGGIIALIGMSNFISYLAHFHRTGTPKPTIESRHGFGSRTFGN